MPGIYGYFDRTRSGCETPTARVSHMAREVERHHTTRLSSYSDDRIAIKNFRFHDSFDSPCPGTEGDPGVFLDGFVLNRQEVIEEIKARGVACRSEFCDETLVRLAYGCMGRHTVDLLRGVFNICVVDKRDSKVTLINCRHGARHIYYALSSECMAFATEPRAIAALGYSFRKVHRRALLDMFNFGYIGGCGTFFEDIQMLEHANILEVGTHTNDRQKYWDYNFHNNENAKSFDDCVDEGIILIDRAVGRYVDRFERCGIPLSGGLDSRTILAFASQGTDSLDAYHCSWFSREELIAKSLSDVCNATWHVYNPLLFDFGRMLKRGFDLSDGSTHAHQFWFTPIAEDICASETVEVLLDGYLMDVFLGDTFLVLGSHDISKVDHVRKIINRIWRRCDPLFAKRILLPEFYAEYEEANVESIDAELQKIDEANISNLIHRFSLANRSNRYSVALPNIQRQFVEYGYPGLDYDLTDFCLCVPPTIKEGAALYREILNRRFPDVAAVPWAKTGKPLTAAKDLFDLAFEKLPVKALGSQFLLRMTGGRVDKSHRGDLNRLFRRDKSFRATFETILRDPRTCSRGIVDSNGVDRLVNLIDGGWPLFTFVQTLITVEMWHRRYVDG
jgi:hypothetical protein